MPLKLIYTEHSHLQVMCGVSESPFGKCFLLGYNHLALKLDHRYRNYKQTTGVFMNELHTVKRINHMLFCMLYYNII